jgi:hypothetical protein
VNIKDTDLKLGPADYGIYEGGHINT